MRGPSALGDPRDPPRAARSSDRRSDPVRWQAVVAVGLLLPAPVAVPVVPRRRRTDELLAGDVGDESRLAMCRSGARSTGSGGAPRPSREPRRSPSPHRRCCPRPCRSSGGRCDRYGRRPRRRHRCRSRPRTTPSSCCLKSSLPPRGCSGPDRIAFSTGGEGPLFPRSTFRQAAGCGHPAPLPQHLDAAAQCAIALPKVMIRLRPCATCASVGLLGLSRYAHHDRRRWPWDCWKACSPRSVTLPGDGR